MSQSLDSFTVPPTHLLVRGSAYPAELAKENQIQNFGGGVEMCLVRTVRSVSVQSLVNFD